MGYPAVGNREAAEDQVPAGRDDLSGTMLSQGSQPKPDTLRKRFQQYRRRHSISHKSPQETQPSSRPPQRQSDLPLKQSKVAHDDFFLKRPQPAVIECHNGRRQPSRQSQPASKAHSQSPGPPVTGQSARVATCDKQPGRVPPSTAQRRGHGNDCRSKTGSALSQKPALGLRRRASSAQCDTAAANANNTIGTSAAPGVNDARNGCEPRVVAATV